MGTYEVDTILAVSRVEMQLERLRILAPRSTWTHEKHAKAVHFRRPLSRGTCNGALGDVPGELTAQPS